MASEILLVLNFSGAYEARVYFKQQHFHGWLNFARKIQETDSFSIILEISANIGKEKAKMSSNCQENFGHEHRKRLHILLVISRVYTAAACGGGSCLDLFDISTETRDSKCGSLCHQVLY